MTAELWTPDAMELAERCHTDACDHIAGFVVQGVPVPQEPPAGPAVSDSDLAFRAMSASASISRSHPAWLRYFVHEGPPASKARARVVNGHAFTPPPTRAAQKSVAKSWRDACPEPIDGNLALVAIFFRQNFQRIDTDNMLKLVLDAGTEARAWADDSHVTTQLGIAEYDAVRPRTVVVLFPIGSTLERGEITIDCPRCGKAFVVGRSVRTSRKYCSFECAHPPALHRCQTCGNEFRRRGTGHRFCSRSCARRAPAELAQKALWNAEHRPPPRCQTCGGRVSRRGYMQCANCSPKGRRAGSKNRPKDVS